MRVILNFAAAQPFVKVRDVIALDPPLSTACQNTSQRQLVEQKQEQCSASDRSFHLRAVNSAALL